MAKAARSKNTHRVEVGFGGLIDELEQPKGPAEPSPNQQTATPRRVYEGITRATIYLPNEVHEVLREVAHTARCKQHDLIMRGLEKLLVEEYGMPPFAELKKTRPTS